MRAWSTFCLFGSLFISGCGGELVLQNDDAPSYSYQNRQSTTMEAFLALQ